MQWSCNGEVSPGYHHMQDYWCPGSWSYEIWSRDKCQFKPVDFWISFKEYYLPSNIPSKWCHSYYSSPQYSRCRCCSMARCCENWYWQGDQLERIWIQQHQQKTCPSGRNGSVRVDGLSQCRQRHPGGGLHRALRQYHSLRCISPFDRRFAVSSRFVGLYEIHTVSFPSFELTRSFYDFVNLRHCVDPRGRVVSYLHTFILHSSSQVDSWSWHGEIERDNLTSCS